MLSFASKCSGSPCHQKIPKKQPLPPKSCYDTPPSSPSLISSLFLTIPFSPVSLSPSLSPPPNPSLLSPCFPLPLMWCQWLGCYSL